MLVSAFMPRYKLRVTEIGTLSQLPSVSPCNMLIEMWNVSKLNPHTVFVCDRRFSLGHAPLRALSSRSDVLETCNIRFQNLVQTPRPVVPNHLCP